MSGATVFQVTEWYAYAGERYRR